jgi:hypothetical protein
MHSVDEQLLTEEQVLTRVVGREVRHFARLTEGRQGLDMDGHNRVGPLSETFNPELIVPLVGTRWSSPQGYADLVQHRLTGADLEHLHHHIREPDHVGEWTGGQGTVLLVKDLDFICDLEGQCVGGGITFGLLLFGGLVGRQRLGSLGHLHDLLTRSLKL